MRWYYVLIVILLVGLGAFFLSKPKNPGPVMVDFPKDGDIISSPLEIRGQARGTWYFEASFPVVLVDWDGRIIAEGYAQTETNWMTEDYVPFHATLTFENPAGEQDFTHRGALILRRDNPSGLPENDAALEIPIKFK